MARIDLYDCGCVLNDGGRFRPSRSSPVGGGVPRGKIEGFSSASRLRLRLALLRYKLDNGSRVGVTLTLPWVVSDWSAVMSDFREVMHRFRVYWLRMFPDCGCVFRVELQKRGAPHVHMVAWHKLPFPSDLSDRYFRLWFDSLSRDLRGGSFSDFARHGVRIDSCPNVIASIRYLCDHASKKKQAQLGYKGKQWGILGKANLRAYGGFSFELNEREFVLFRRFLRRLCRFRVKSDCVFGSRLSHVSCITKVIYCSDSTIERFFLSLKIC